MYMQVSRRFACLELRTFDEGEGKRGKGTKIDLNAVTKFDYHMLWSMLKEDLVPLIGAILTALLAAYVNLQIPLNIGQVSPPSPSLCASTITTNRTLALSS